MAYPVINRSKCTKQCRLIYKITAGVAFNLALTFLYAAIALFACLAILLKSNVSHTIASTVLIRSIALYVVISTYLTHILVKVKGSDKASNREYILKSLGAFYDGINVNTDWDNTLRLVIPNGWISPKKMITVLLDGEDVYINILTLGRFDAWSPFHGVFNYYRCKRILWSFQSML